MKTIFKNVAAGFLRKRHGKGGIISAYGESPMKHRSCVAFFTPYHSYTFPFNFKRTKSVQY